MTPVWALTGPNWCHAALDDQTMVAILFYPGKGGGGVGVRNDQAVERDRGVQYGLHTGTGLCRCLKGGAVPQRPVCLTPPQNLNVTASVREKKKGMDLEEGA